MKFQAICILTSHCNVSEGVASLLVLVFVKVDFGLGLGIGLELEIKVVMIKLA